MDEDERPRNIQTRVSKDRISSLPDDLLIQILSRVPTEDAVATTFLSKRWRYVWIMLPRLDYKDTGKRKSIWWLLDQSIRLYQAPRLERLRIRLGRHCPVDVDVTNWVAKAIDCCVRNLLFALHWKTEPIRMPQALYTCNTLARLALISAKIIVDVPSPVSLPSLTQLELIRVVYRDEDSHVRLLSGCPVLKHLTVVRYADVDDNVRKFSVKVPSLLTLWYELRRVNEDDTDRSLVIDTPALMHVGIFDSFGGSCTIEYMPHIVTASIAATFYPEDNFLSSLSSIKNLELYPFDTMVPWCNAVNYFRLIECRLRDFDPDWCESLVVLLTNCPVLKKFMVDCNYEIDRSDDHVPVLWDQPSSVPKCLSSCLEFFRYTGYAGREDERELIRYISQNSKCLNRAEICLNPTCNREEEEQMAEEFTSMPKVFVLKPETSSV
ncbi:unnamed protein product [Thlaspi arvense]|uniref:F-box domain-containing protein n=1 Tax=Thlaspi arvense TaxID=13288 RepID=A0AAU9SGU1_THLAR|nr:unnamed protein product [Thlaspi arvense]